MRQIPCKLRFYPKTDDPNDCLFTVEINPILERDRTVPMSTLSELNALLEAKIPFSYTRMGEPEIHALLEHENRGQICLRMRIVPNELSRDDVASLLRAAGFINAICF